MSVAWMINTGLLLFTTDYERPTARCILPSHRGRVVSVQWRYQIERLLNAMRRSEDGPAVWMRYPAQAPLAAKPNTRKTLR